MGSKLQRISQDGFGCEFCGDSHVFDGESQFIPTYHALNRIDWGEFQSFVDALFYLAALPEHIGPLCEEVEEVIVHKGWTKEALDQMYKVDTFIKESQRKSQLGNCECCSILC